MQTVPVIGEINRVIETTINKTENKISGSGSFPLTEVPLYQVLLSKLLFEISGLRDAFCNGKIT